MNNLKHIDHGRYSIDAIRYANYNLKNPNVKVKEYELDNSEAVDNDKLAYIQILYNKYLKTALSHGSGGRDMLQHLRCFVHLD